MKRTLLLTLAFPALLSAAAGDDLGLLPEPKRVVRTGANAGTFSVRMFRLDFAVDEAARVVTLLGIRSGYTAAELAAADDPYADKAVHRAFVAAQARCT